MATGINFSGLSSGIDFSQITDAIIAQQGRSVNLLRNKKETLSGRSDALKQLNAQLIKLKEAATALTDRTLGGGRTATAVPSTVVTASSTDAAAPGTINLNVTRLATSLSQSSRVYAASTTPVLAGGATTATFELRKGGAATGTAITIDSSNNTLAGLRDAINNANAGVTASIVDTDGTGTQNKLVLNSTATGAAGRVQLVETTATGTAADINLTSLNPPGATTDFSALDATLTVNGLPITRSTNTISDAVTGVTFNLLATGTATTTVTPSTSAINDKLKAFIDAYNSVQDFVAKQYAPGSSGRPSGPLAGDPTLRAVQQQVRDAVGAASNSNGGAFKNLTQIGIGRDSTGKLTLDTNVLNDKLKTSFSDVQALFSGKTAANTGIANSMVASFTALSDSATGMVQNAINGNTSSITSIDKSINAQLDRLNSLRTSLTRQFAAAEKAIGQLNGQNTTLSTVIKSLEPRSNR